MLFHFVSVHGVTHVELNSILVKLKPRLFVCITSFYSVKGMMLGSC